VNTPATRGTGISRSRGELLEELVTALARADPSLRLDRRSTGDATVALLDAWATAGDVLGFYLDRIAAEGYLPSAVEAGSIIALAGLLGATPQPSVASRVCLAYTLQPDPTDAAVIIAAGQLAQSVPGAGETPQTFETATDLVARPSWNTLAPRGSTPLTVDPGHLAVLSSLMVAGASTGLNPNDRILLDLVAGASSGAAVVRVAHIAPDLTAQTTEIAVQTPASEPRSAPAPGPPSLPEAVDGLLDALEPAPTPVPSSATTLARTPASVFGPGSDAVPRLLSALRPGIAGSLYPALASTAIGERTVVAASAMRVAATPFGADVPSIQLTDDSGNPAGVEDPPIGDTHVLELTLNKDALGTLVAAVGGAVPEKLALSSAPTPTPTPAATVAACRVGGRDAEAALDPNDGWTQTVTLGDLGTLEVAAVAAGAGPAVVIAYTPRPDGDPLPAPVGFKISLDSTGTLLVFNFDGDKTDHAWEPAPGNSLRVQLDVGHALIAWGSSASKTPVVHIEIVTPLRLADRTILYLDKAYATIVPGSRVVVEQAADATASPAGPAPATSAVLTRADAAVRPTYPLVATVDAVDDVDHSAYGRAAKVTRLVLSGAWIGDADTTVASLRRLKVRAQPDPLTLRPVPLPADAQVSGSSIDLDTLAAGMDAGRLILVTGTRVDLPAGASASGGELAMVAGITQVAGGAGEAPRSTLRLDRALACSYLLSSVKIYGNVVRSHQGATTREVLGSGAPARSGQRLTVSGTPILADLAPDGRTAASTLSVSVDGVPAVAVPRIAADLPPRAYVTGGDAGGRTTITFAAPLPAGTGNVAATYRIGDGGAGNVRAHQISQLLSRPLNVSAVDNPLPASGGIGAEGPEDLRAGAPVGLGGLGRLVSLPDYAAFASGWPGVAKVTVRAVGGGTGERALVTVAGSQPPPLDPSGPICAGLATGLARAGDPLVPAAVVPARLWMILLAAAVTHEARTDWSALAGAVRAALLAAFAYAGRELGADVRTGDLAAAALAVPGVLDFTVTALALAPTSAMATQLAKLLPVMLAPAGVPSRTSFVTAARAWDGQAPGPDAADSIAFLSPLVPDTLLLTERLA
jgi:hypothetical protein